MKASQQPPFMIFVPIAHDAKWPGLAARQIERLLDSLGNPAGRPIRAALKQCGHIHFMSLSAIWDETPGDKPYLVADIAADGPADDVVDALVACAGPLFLPVFNAATGVDSLAGLAALLKRNIRFPMQVPRPFWPFWPRGATGVAFQGTPGLTVKRIRKDRLIAKAARRIVFGHPAGGGASPLAYVAAAAKAARLGPLPLRRSIAEETTDPPQANTTTLANILSVSGKFVFDWWFVIIILLGVLWFNILDVVQGLGPNPYAAFAHLPFRMVVAVLAVTAMLRGVSDWLRRKMRSLLGMLARLWGLVGRFVLPTILVLVMGILFVRTPMVAKTQFLADLLSDPIGTVWSALASIGRWFETHWLGPWVAFALAAGALFLFLLTAAVGLAAALRAYELTDKPLDEDPDPARIAEIMRRENQGPQNHMIGVSIIKDGFFRRFLSLPFALYGVGLLVKARVFQPGFLSNIGTIHFAQWVNVPGTRKLLFVSNYDGSWQSYLEDFIARARQGASAIWSNTVDFPKTTWLISGGAGDGDRFKRWGRRQMIPTRFWYSAYPKLTATEVRTNAEIRRVLEAADKVTVTQAEAWLKLFGSAPRPVNSLEIDQIQGLTLDNYSELVEGVFLAVTFPDETAMCKAWLREALPCVTFGDQGGAGRATSIAISAHGLERLGVGGEAGAPLASHFSAAFAMGMACESKGLVLGDTGDNAWEKWEWGRPDQPPVDAVLLLYAADAATLQDQLQTERDRFDRFSLAARPETWLRKRLGSGLATEAFGFVDGISQPQIKGLPIAPDAPTGSLLEPGEFILGYKDGRKQFPPTPLVFGVDDRDRRLPELPAGYPEPPSVVAARPHHAPALRDLGRNGSYLVIRQLEQDVAAYEHFIKKAARAFPERPNARDWVGAKMLGRWKNGAPLVRYPDAPPARYDAPYPDEDFLFAADDPQGLACPFGAHIRRANPRDHFGVGDAVGLSLTNRHRILRRGRSYVTGHTSDVPASGLMFMCMNADIERQFEFLQQTWIGSSAFSTLQGESDPIAAMTRAKGTFTIPMPECPARLTGIPSFVTLKGGGYFFLPGRRTLEYLAA
jgi:Dyp-type peroxidase family